MSVDRIGRQEAISFLSFTNCVLGKWIGSAAAAAAAARSTCLSFPRLETDWTAQQQQLGTDRVSYRTTNGCPATDGIDGHHSSSSLDLRHKQNNKKKKKKKKKKSVDWLHVTCPDHLVTSSNRKKKGRKKDREVILSSNEASTFIHEQERRKKMLYYVWTEMNEWMQSRQPLKRSRPTNKERDIVTAVHHFRQEKLLSAEYFWQVVHHFHFLSLFLLIDWPHFSCRQRERQA